MIRRVDYVKYIAVGIASALGISVVEVSAEAYTVNLELTPATASENTMDTTITFSLGVASNQDTQPVALTGQITAMLEIDDPAAPVVSGLTFSDGSIALADKFFSLTGNALAVPIPVQTSGLTGTPSTITPPRGGEPDGWIV